ncbi:hypothetical protein Tco_0341099 [Tanacetum coccineum]
MTTSRYVSPAAAAISIKLILVIDLPMVSNKFDLLVSSCSESHANSQTNSIEDITCNQLGNNFHQGPRFIDLRFINNSYQPVAHHGPAPQTHGVPRTDLKDNVTCIDQCEKHANQGPKAVNHDTEVTKDTMPPTNNGSTEDVQPPVVQIQTRNPNPESNVYSSEVTPVPKASIHSITRRMKSANVYEGEITLRVGKEAITFNLDQTSKYTADYNHMTVNKIDVIDMACDEYSQEVLGFSNVIASGNPTPYSEPIVSTASPTLTPFGDSDFLLFEEADSFLALEDDPTSSEVDPTYQDPEGDILILEAILNTKTVEPSIDEPPEVELKELPPHLEYAFLEGDNKLPVIIAKDLKDEEKAALLKVLKSHKRAIAWKLSDIKGVSPEFCTHKILMEEDYKPTVQSQRRVNPKIHDVIKKEVEKLLDAGLIYPISDSPWVSPVHYEPKKGGITVVKNDDNELIPTRLVTG